MKRATRPTPNDTELRMARLASRFAAMEPGERREKVHLAAWRCHCLALGRRIVKQGYGKNEYTGKQASV